MHRSPRGTWTEVGEIALNDPAFRESLAFLRSTVVGLEGKRFGTKLIIPNSQVLYCEAYAPGPSENERRAQIMAELEGKTPYEVADLAFDWHGAGATVQVAVVAKETLDEAEDFAVEHRFNPVSFAGHESDEPGAWEPFFGRSDFSFAFLGVEVDVRDTPLPEALGAPEPETQANTDTADSLFASETPDETSEEDTEPVTFEFHHSEPNHKNLFVETLEETVPDNLFTTSSTEQETPDTAPPAEEPDLDATEEPAPEPEAPSFSTRRMAGDQILEGEDERPISRVAPRIEIAPDEPDDRVEELIEDPAQAVQPPPELGPAITAQAHAENQAESLPEDHLRSSILGEERDSEATPAAPNRFGAIAEKAGTVGRQSLKSAAKLGDAAGRLARQGLSSTAKIGAAASSAAAAASKKMAQRKQQDPEAEIAPAPTPELTDINDAFSDEIPASQISTFQGQSRSKPDAGNGRLIFLSATIALVVIGLIGIAYTILPPGELTTGPSAENSEPDAEVVLITTSPERGVHADNRARLRPSDFAERVAGLPPSDGLDSVFLPVRPERRSLYEDEPDPDANLPDTATPVTELTEQELADIRAAGIPAPTQEEIAEAGEGSEEDKATTAELAKAYERTGVLQGLRRPPTPRQDQTRDAIFVASVDRDLEANDAIILPDFSHSPQDDQPGKKISPLGPDVVFDLDERGLVKATNDGAINPEGILVYAGKPAVTPPTKPETEELVPPNPLEALTPKPRPADLKTGENAIFVQGRLTVAELRSFRAKARPESEQAQLQTDSDGATPSELAILTSFQPSHRPSDFAETVEKTQVKVAAATPATAPFVDSGPVLPTRASVAKQATFKNAINLSTINLIGVYGTPSKRNALLRLPSGRYVKVKIGDRIDGGKVAAIGSNTLSYVKSGRSRVLKIP